MDLMKLAEEIAGGRRLNYADDLSFFIDCDLDELCQAADFLRKHFVGDKIDLCTIINGKSGHCGENCKFCAQSVHNNTGCKVSDFIEEDEIVAACKENEREGVHRFSIVTSGKALDGEDFEKAVSAYKRLNSQCNVQLCASHGFLSEHQLKRLVAAGVTRYHHNIETSPRFFKNICTSHSFEMKVRTIKTAQRLGLTMCSGGILGMGETWKDRIDMALVLMELGIKSIPLNILTPIKGTPLENNTPLTEEEILRAVGIFRFINPEAHIRMAAGRITMSEYGKKAFESGASATITGNMLTTTGATIEKDKEMFRNLGRIS